MAHGKLIVLTGPSASGKTTIAAELLATDRTLARLVTCTTRAPRPNEVNGIDYHFLDRATFEAGVKQGSFFEWAKVYDDYYGSRKEDVEKLIRAGKCAVVVVDAQGAATVKHIMPNALIIFVKSPLEDLKRRLPQRAGFTHAEINKRASELERELKMSGSADFAVENKDGHLSEAVLAVREYLQLAH